MSMIGKIQGKLERLGEQELVSMVQGAPTIGFLAHAVTADLAVAAKTCD